MTEPKRHNLAYEHDTYLYRNDYITIMREGLKDIQAFDTTQYVLVVLIMSIMSTLIIESMTISCNKI